jgi:RND family efflux transporter MFP subunit
LVDIGDKVNKGQTLATIDTPELDAQLMAAEAKFKAAEAQVAVEKSNAQFAKSTWERWRDSPKGVVSEQEREAKKADYDSSVAKLQAAEAQVRLNKADVDSLKALTAFKEVTAPYNGVVTSRRIDIGDLVTAGSTSSTTSLYNIAQSDTVRVFADVPQSASSDMAVGLPALATSSEFPDRKFQGKITRTAHAIDPVSRTLHVEVDIPNSDLTLVPGMYVEVNFELAKKALLQVPASALLFRSSGEQVAVIGPDGKVNFRKVTIALDQGDFVEIGSGLSPGDRVALNISSEIDDGDVVTVNEIDHPEAAPAPRPGPTTRLTPVELAR